LKDSYFKQARINLDMAGKRFSEKKAHQETMFADEEVTEL